MPGAVRGSVSESWPHLIFDGFESGLGRRVVQVLKHLWPPREAVDGDSAKVGSRVVTFKNIEDAIEVRHHVFVKTGYKSVELAEVGPRMTMRLFEIRGGTLENKDGDVEVCVAASCSAGGLFAHLRIADSVHVCWQWHLNQYTRTSRKKNYL